MSDNYFSDLNQVDVSKHVEKKGGFSYLSWAYAVAELKKRHPSATWEFKRFDGLPYQKTDLGYFVEACVTVEGITHCQLHPVLDNRNKPMTTPTVFDINTSNQRALVKAIALHGLGLYIYAGEDLPEKEPTTRVNAQQKRDWAEQTRAALSKGDGAEAKKLWDEWDNEEKIELWSALASQERTAFKLLLGDV